MREKVYLGLGSNIEPERHLRAGIVALEEKFGRLRLSPVYRSAAVGFPGADFINACAEIETGLEPVDLKAWLSGLEDAHGRRRGMPKFSDRTLDIDVLLHGDRVGDFGEVTLPRGEILKYAHVLKPLTDLIPGHRHPLTGKTFAEHWRDYDGDRGLEVVDFDRLDDR